jgi:ketosteroid isomerase-like protein
LNDAAGGGGNVSTLSIDDVRRYEQRLLGAMLRSDLDELDTLLADDLVFTDHLGALWRKQDDLAAHRSGAIKVRAVTASDEHFRLFAGAAVVSVLVQISGTFAGQEASGAFRFTRVWAATPGRQWQVVAAHSTLVAE